MSCSFNSWQVVLQVMLCFSATPSSRTQPQKQANLNHKSIISFYHTTHK